MAKIRRAAPKRWRPIKGSHPITPPGGTPRKPLVTFTNDRVRVVRRRIWRSASAPTNDRTVPPPPTRPLVASTNDRTVPPPPARPLAALTNDRTVPPPPAPPSRPPVAAVEPRPPQVPRSVAQAQMGAGASLLDLNLEQVGQGAARLAQAGVNALFGPGSAQGMTEALGQRREEITEELTRPVAVGVPYTGPGRIVGREGNYLIVETAPLHQPGPFNPETDVRRLRLDPTTGQLVDDAHRTRVLAVQHKKPNVLDMASRVIGQGLGAVLEGLAQPAKGVERGMGRAAQAVGADRVMQNVALPTATGDLAEYAVPGGDPFVPAVAPRVSGLPNLGDQARELVSDYQRGVAAAASVVAPLVGAKPKYETVTEVLTREFGDTPRTQAALAEVTRVSYSGTDAMLRAGYRILALNEEPTATLYGDPAIMDDLLEAGYADDPVQAMLSIPRVKFYYLRRQGELKGHPLTDEIIMRELETQGLPGEARQGHELAGQVVLDPLNLVGGFGVEALRAGRAGLAADLFNYTDELAEEVAENAYRRLLRPTLRMAGREFDISWLPFVRTPSAVRARLMEDGGDGASVVLRAIEASAGKADEFGRARPGREVALRAFVAVSEPKPVRANFPTDEAHRLALDAWTRRQRAAATVLEPFGLERVAQSRAGKLGSLLVREMMTDANGRIGTRAFRELFGGGKPVEEVVLDLMKRYEDTAERVLQPARQGATGVAEWVERTGQAAQEFPIFERGIQGTMERVRVAKAAAQAGLDYSVDPLTRLLAGWGHAQAAINKGLWDAFASFNPSFSARNFLNNLVTAMVDGTFTLESRKSVEKFLEVVYDPMAAHKGFGIGGATGKWFAGGLKAFGIPLGAQSVEEAMGSRIVAKAARDFLERQMVIGKAIPELPRSIADKLGDDLLRGMVHAIANGYGDVQAGVQWLKENVGEVARWRIMADADRATLRAFSPELADEVADLLRTAKSEDDLRRGLAAIREKWRVLRQKADEAIPVTLLPDSEEYAQVAADLHILDDVDVAEAARMDDFARRLAAQREVRDRTLHDAGEAVAQVVDGYPDRAGQVIREFNGLREETGRMARAVREAVDAEREKTWRLYREAQSRFATRSARSAYADQLWADYFAYRDRAWNDYTERYTRAWREFADGLAARHPPKGRPPVPAGAQVVEGSSRPSDTIYGQPSQADREAQAMADLQRTYGPGATDASGADLAEVHRRVAGMPGPLVAEGRVYTDEGLRAALGLPDDIPISAVVDTGYVKRSGGGFVLTDRALRFARVEWPINRTVKPRGFVFVSPNVNDRSLMEDAINEFGGEAHRRSAQAMADDLNELGVSGGVAPGIGVWVDVGETSSASLIFEDVDRATLRYLAAKGGLRDRQKLSIAFKIEDAGPHRIYFLDVDDDEASIYRAAMQIDKGLSLSLVSLRDGGVRVIIADNQVTDGIGQIEASVRQLGEYYGAHIYRAEGYLEEVGDNLTWDRDVAANLFREEIAAWEARRNLAAPQGLPQSGGDLGRRGPPAQAFQGRVVPQLPPEGGSAGAYTLSDRALVPRPEALDATLDRIEGAALAQWGVTRAANLDEADWRVLEDWARHATARTVEARAIAGRVGVEARNFALLNYSDKRNLDMWLAAVFPYHYWYGRTYKNWARRAVANPGALAAYAKYRMALKQLHGALPDYWQQQLSTNDLGLPLAEPLVFNLEATLSPLYGIMGDDFTDPDRRRAKLLGWDGAGALMEDVGRFGPSLWTPIIWAAALSTFRDDPEAATAWLSYLGQPFRALRSATAMLPEGVRQSLRVPPGGVNFDPNLILSGVLAGDGLRLDNMTKWEKGYVANRMYEMAANPPTGTNAQDHLAQLMEQGYARRGPLWDAAVQSMFAKAGPRVLASYAFGIGFKGRTPQEIQISRMWEAVRSLQERQAEMTPEEIALAYADLRERHPGYDLLRLVRSAGPKRDDAWMWEAVSRAGLDAYDLWESLGVSQEALDEFYRVKTTDGMDPILRDELIRAATAINAALRPVTPNEARDRATARQKRRDLDAALVERFGAAAQVLEDEFFRVRDEQGPEAADAWLEALPEAENARLTGLWDARQAALVSDPALAAYYADTDDYKAYLTGRFYDAQEAAQPGVRELAGTYQDLKNAGEFDAARLLLDEHPELKDYWDAQSRFYEVDLPREVEAWAKAMPAARRELRQDVRPEGAAQEAVTEFAGTSRRAPLETETPQGNVSLFDQYVQKSAEKQAREARQNGYLSSDNRAVYEEMLYDALLAPAGDPLLAEDAFYAVHPQGWSAYRPISGEEALAAYVSGYSGIREAMLLDTTSKWTSVVAWVKTLPAEEVERLRRRFPDIGYVATRLAGWGDGPSEALRADLVGLEVKFNLDGSISLSRMSNREYYGGGGPARGGSGGSSEVVVGGRSGGVAYAPGGGAASADATAQAEDYWLQTMQTLVAYPDLLVQLQDYLALSPYARTGLLTRYPGLALWLSNLTPEQLALLEKGYISWAIRTGRLEEDDAWEMSYQRPDLAPILRVYPKRSETTGLVG